MLDFALIFIGAGIGGVLRFVIGSLVYAHYGRNFPYGTLVVNLTGCLIIGFAYVLITRKAEDVGPWLVGFVIVGILGGYTTFSSFSLETLDLIQKGRLLYATYNVCLSVGCGIFATFIGFKLAELIVK
jgi:CrcB protein